MALPVPLFRRPVITDSAASAASRSAIATVVPDNRSVDFLPALFGLAHMLRGEYAVYRALESLSPDYGGGFWEFCERNGAPLYLRPASDKRFRLVCDGNGYAGEVSADAAGIITTLFAFSHLSFSVRSDRMAEGYQRLYTFAGDHPEAREIFGAID